MGEFLAPVRQHLDAHAPHPRSLFDVMAGEARFARSWLDDDWGSLPEGALIVEVGGGALLLTYKLARESFAGTPIERRSPWLVSAIKMLKANRLWSLASQIPANCQPLMDARTKLG